MTVQLNDSDRSRLQGMVRRPRSRKQYYRARALLELDAGRPIEEVARVAKVGIERVEEWIDGYARLRLAYLDEPAGPKAKPVRRGREPADDPEDA